jgi:hypothetical protein
MSAPVSHHPLVVNTADGSCWTRRAVTSDGRGLYALAGSVAEVPDEVLVSLADLAELGITGSAFALPVPVGPVLRSELDQARDDVMGACLARWEEEQENARLRLALASARRGRSRLRARVSELEYVAPSPSCTRCYGADAVRFVAQGGATAPCPVCGPLEVERLQARVAELEAQHERRRVRLVALQNDALNMRGALSPNGEERKVPMPMGDTLAPAVEWLINRVAELELERHPTNEALDDAVQALRAKQDEPAAPYVSRLLPPRDAVCARPECGHSGEEHHHGDTKCWAHLPKKHGDPITICGCSGFVEGPSADRLTAFFVPVASLREDSHDGPLHHSYRVSRELPESGGAQ